jgi:formylglycine-generating enzyme required for sulfatase activity
VSKITKFACEAEGFTPKLGNGASLGMVYIPPGKFLMGSPDGEGDSDEHPQHQVTVSPFY